MNKKEISEKVEELKKAATEDKAEFREIKTESKLYAIEMKPEAQLNYLLQLLENNAAYQTQLNVLFELDEENEDINELKEELNDIRSILRGYIKTNWKKLHPFTPPTKVGGFSGVS